MNDIQIPEGYKLVPVSHNGELTEQVAVRMTPATLELVERLANTFHPPYARGQAIRWILELSVVEDLVASREAADDE